MVKIRKRQRRYTGILQYFHNFEHDPNGLTHCHSDGEYPYTIKHHEGKHIISNQIARGHGRGGKPQWFYFPDKLGDGFDMTSAIKTDNPKQVSKLRLPQRKILRITPRMPRISR